MRTYLKILFVYWEIKTFIKANGIKEKRAGFNFYSIKVNNKEFERDHNRHLTVTNTNDSSTYSIYKSWFRIYIDRTNVLTDEVMIKRVDLKFLETILKYLYKHTQK